MRRCSIYFGVLAGVLAAFFVGPAGGSNGNHYAFGQNVDPNLASTINATQTAGNATTNSTYHVIVFGNAPDLSHADSFAGVSQRNNLSTVGAQSLTVTAAQAAALSSQPGVQFVTADTPMAPDSNGNGNGNGNGNNSGLSAANLQTLYPQIDGAPSLWSQGVTGSGVGIAIIDSGVTPRADFGNRLVQVQLPTQDSTALNDTVGHGSAVAGVAAGQSPDGQYIGIAPGATVYAVNVARADGVYTSDVIAGLLWVLANAKKDNIGVVNLSLSQTTPSSYYTSTLDSVVDMLWKQGIVVVTAAGNFGPNTEDFAPANDPWAITVGASDSNDTLTTSDDTLADFSSYGTTPDGFSKPEIVAPGRHIVTTIPGDSTIAQAAPPGYLVGSGEDNYVKISGTSFSAPQVAGAVALILQNHQNLNPDQIKAILVQSESPLSGSNAGVLNLANIASAIAKPGNGNSGLHWSNWAHAGENTHDFLNALGAQQISQNEQQAAAWDAQAQVSCTNVASAPTPPGPASAPTPPGPASAPTPPGPAPKKAQPAPPAPPSPAWSDCANKLDQAAAAWYQAAGEWAQQNQLANASNDENNAAQDWQSAAADWTHAGNAQKAAADTNSHAAAWDQAAAWDHAAAWDAAAWDQAAAWDYAAAWDAAAWDSATWDHAAAWDAAAWDAAAWDAAAWDAAAWD